MAPGLRERKRLAAMHRIQSVALDLFDERGFGAVTVEEIADAAEVSPSTVYRYFGTKEQVVVWDEFDPVIAERLLAEMAGSSPLEAARNVLLKAIGGLSADDERRIARRVRLVMTSPALETASVANTYALSETLGAVLARRMGRPPEDLELQVFSHTLVGGLLGAFHHWHGTGFREPLGQVLRRCFEILEDGLDVVGQG